MAGRCSRTPDPAASTSQVLVCDTTSGQEWYSKNKNEPWCPPMCKKDHLRSLSTCAHKQNQETQVQREDIQDCSLRTTGWHCIPQTAWLLVQKILGVYHETLVWMSKVHTSEYLFPMKRTFWYVKALTNLNDIMLNEIVTKGQSTSNNGVHG